MPVTFTLSVTRKPAGRRQVATAMTQLNKTVRGHRRIFLSYKREDARFAINVRSALEQCSIDVAMYNPNEPWDDPVEKIYLSVTATNAVLWLRNNRAPSPWILPELKLARLSGLPIFELNQISELTDIIRKITKEDRAGDISHNYAIDPVGSPDAPSDRLWQTVEEAFSSVDGGNYESEWVGVLNWKGKQEADELTGQAFIKLIVLLAPLWGLVLSLIAACVGAVFWPKALAFALCLILLFSIALWLGWRYVRK